MQLITRNICVFTLAAIGPCFAQTSPANIMFAPAAIGIGTTPSTVLFSQPYRDEQTSGGNLVPRGVYVAGATSPLITLPPSAHAENYFAIASGLGGFAAGSFYIYGQLSGSPTIFSAPAGGGAPSTFIANLPVGMTAASHVSLAFDRVGTFGFNLIATGSGGVQGYTSAGALTFSYPNPASATFRLEAATVAPLTYPACPGCLFFTAEDEGGVGAIYVIHPGAPNGTMPAFFATGPAEPEGIVFVPATPCSVGRYSYFVSGFSVISGPQQGVSPGGGILQYTSAQLSPYTGKFLVPDEASGVIYAYSGPNLPGAAPNRTVFSNTGYQLEGSTLAACPVHGTTTGFMTGGGQMSEYRASLDFNLGCNVGSHHDDLEVNWAGGNNFHLGTILSVTCLMGPTEPSHDRPEAGFNTLVLTGTGKFNNQPGATVSLIFTDAGERENGNEAQIRISFGGSTVLNVPVAKLATGNHEAH